LGKDDDYFPMESTFDLSSSFFDADFGEVASESVTDANTASYNSKESSKLVSNSRSSNYKDTLDATTTSYISKESTKLVSNSRSSNYKDTLDATTTSYNSKESTKLVSNSRSSNYKDTLDATTTSYNSKESSQHVSYEQDASSKSVYRDVLELITDTNLVALVNKMYDSANSNGCIGSLGVPRSYPESFYEPFEKKKDSFIIGGFIDESTGKYLRKWLTVEQSLKVRFCLRNLNLCFSKEIQHIFFPFISHYSILLNEV
jgi:murein L,D-transpeptidase YcbB/YkuD